MATAAWGQGRTPREQTILNLFGRLNLAVDPHDNLNYWMDNYAFYRPFFSNVWQDFGAKPRANGDTIFLCGGSLHEGGYTLKILLDAAGKMKIAETDYQYTKGDPVEYRLVGGEVILIIRDVRTNAAKAAFKKFDGNLRNKITGGIRRYLLAGRYLPANGSGGNILFAPEKEAVSGFKGSGEKSYRFIQEYETPAHKLFFGDKEAYLVTKTLTGLELAPLCPHPEYGEEIDWVEEGDMLVVDKKKPVIRLNKTAELIPGLPAGRFPLASVEVMTLAQLSCYAGNPQLANLQVMRNEIYARHGYKFKAGGEMARYFGQQEWYRPQFDDVTSKLTDIERINIELIQALEKDLKEHA